MPPCTPGPVRSFIAIALGTLVSGCSSSSSGGASSDETAIGADAGNEMIPDARSDAPVEASMDGATTGGDGAAPYPHPSSCAEVVANLAVNGGASPPDGNYTLYLGGDEAKPWTAFCLGMSQPGPHEFLDVEELTNQSQHTDGARYATTQFRRYRIDPAAPALLPLDTTFASTTDDGGILTDVALLPAGFARYSGAGGGGAATASVDLAGSFFAFASAIAQPGYFAVRSSLGDASAVVGSESVVAADLSGFQLTAVSTVAGDTVVVSAYAPDVLTSPPAIESVTLPLTYAAP